MTPRELSEKVKQLVPMSVAVRHYGFEPDRAGFIFCPFHAEKTASCKIYESSFYCFGCGAGGDLINFVKLLYGLNFKAALMRLNTDFNLNIGVGRSQNGTDPERLRQINAERRQREKELQKYREKYNSYAVMFWELWTKQKTQPLTENERIKLNILDDWLYENPYR